MLDLQLLRNDVAAVALRLQARGYILDTAKFEKLEARRKVIQTLTQELQAKRNTLSKHIGAAKSKGDDTSALMAEVAGIGGELKELQSELAGVQTELREWLLAMPNLAHPSVAVGTSETAELFQRGLSQLGLEVSERNQSE